MLHRHAPLRLVANPPLGRDRSARGDPPRDAHRLPDSRRPSDVPGPLRADALLTELKRLVDHGMVTVADLEHAQAVIAKVESE